MNTRPFFQVVPKSVQLWAWITVGRYRCDSPDYGNSDGRRSPRLVLDNTPLHCRWPLHWHSGRHLAAWPRLRIRRRPPALHATRPLGPGLHPGSASVGLLALFRAAPTPRISLWSLRTSGSFRPAILLVVRDSPASPSVRQCTIPLRPEPRNQPLTAPPQPS